MTDMIFLKILDMSLNGCIAVAFVIIARLFLKKSPKIYSYVIWLIVLFRLVCPFSIESQTGIVPSVNEPVTTERYTVVRSAVRSGLAGGAGQYTAVREAAKTISWVTVGKYVWLVGVAALLIYGLVSLARLKKRLKNAVLAEDGVYLANIEEPFVIGVVRPKIYIPNKLDVREREYILLHEGTHIKRLDHITRMAAFIVLCVHWFNPFVWLAFALSGRDMEMSCDETVIRTLGNSAKKEYSALLLSLTAAKASPIGVFFGGNDIKGRIKNVLSFKKASVWVSAVSFLIVIFVGVFTIPDKKMPYSSVSSMIIAENEAVLSSGKVAEVRLELVDFLYGTDEDFALGGGISRENFVGNGVIRVSVDGELTEELEIGRLVFNSPSFDIGFADYNEDGDPDFAIGQWGSSSIDLYSLFSIDGNGMVRWLSEEWEIASSEKMGERSPVFEYENSNINTYLYNNAIGKNQTAVYKYNEETGLFTAADSRDIGIQTVEDDPIGCEFGRTSGLDTLEILEALEDLNGFEFTSAVAEHMYVRLVFFVENPESIYLSYVSDGVWQREYPIDSADYSIKVPADKGIYNFFAYITWENGDTETIFFDITVQ